MGREEFDPMGDQSSDPNRNDVLGLLKFLGMVAATVIVAVIAARLIQALLTALGLGFG